MFTSKWLRVMADSQAVVPLTGIFGRLENLSLRVYQSKKSSSVASFSGSYELCARV